MFKLFWRASRGRYLPLSILAVFLAAAIVRWEKVPISGFRLLLVLAGAALVHLGANLWNDWADEQNGADRANPAPSPFNGGSRVIQRGELSARQVRNLAVACAVLCLALAAILSIGRGPAVMILTLIGFFLAWAYSSPPLFLNGRGWGEATVAFCFGPLLAEGAAIALGGRFSPTVLWASLALGLIVADVLAINALLDASSDASVGKISLAVRLGQAALLRVYIWIIAAAFLVLAAAIWRGALPKRAAVVFIILPLSFHLSLRARQAAGSREKAALPNAGTIVLQYSLGLLLILGFMF
jgi:1,4-dihydroxy-2-naphthoate polyprenyltransferase